MSDNKCARCGHSKSEHAGGEGHCRAIVAVVRVENTSEPVGSGIFYCNCTNFVSKVRTND